jgi:5-methylcytosine-specific restriction endonuclease McrA
MKRNFSIDKFKADYLSGMSCQEIKDKYNLDCNVKTIQRIVKKMGIIRPCPEAFRLACKRGRVNWEHLKKSIKAGSFRKTFGKKMRFTVLERDGFRCVFCGATSKDVYLQVDHIVPPEYGGKNELGNLRTVCGDCNQGIYHLHQKILQVNSKL